MCVHRERGMLLKYSIHKTLTELFLIPWHISQNRYIGMAEGTSTCDSQGERETFQVYSYTPQALSFVPQSTFGPKVDRTHDRRKPGADPLASKIAWPNTKRYVKDSLFLPPLPQDLPQLGRRIVSTTSDIDCDMLQRVWAETDYRLDVWRASTVHMRHGGKKHASFFFHLFVTFTILSALCHFYNPFRSSSVPILWSVREVWNKL